MFSVVFETGIDRFTDVCREVTDISQTALTRVAQMSVEEFCGFVPCIGLQQSILLDLVSVLKSSTPF